MTPSFTAKTAYLMITIAVLFESDSAELPTDLANADVEFYAEDDQGRGLNYYTQLSVLLSDQVLAIDPSTDNWVPVTIPSVTVEIYTEHDYNKLLRSYPIPAFLLKTCQDDSRVIRPSSILKLIETHYGGFSGQVPFVPIFQPQAA